MMPSREHRLGLLQGTLDLLILQALVDRTRHGYEIARWIEATTKTALSVEEGSLYPALHRMVQKGWLVASWGVSENNRRAKFYSLTDEGASQLHAERRKWSRFAEAMALVVDAQPARGT
jgi:transcriptional regulator